jgi:hypothetical protein
MCSLVVGLNGYIRWWWGRELFVLQEMLLRQEREEARLVQPGMLDDGDFYFDFKLLAEAEEKGLTSTIQEHGMCKEGGVKRMYIRWQWG